MTKLYIKQVHIVEHLEPLYFPKATVKLIELKCSPQFWLNYSTRMPHFGQQVNCRICHHRTTQFLQVPGQQAKMRDSNVLWNNDFSIGLNKLSGESNNYVKIN